MMSDKKSKKIQKTSKIIYLDEKFRLIKRFEKTCRYLLAILKKFFHKKAIFLWILFLYKYASVMKVGKIMGRIEITSYPHRYNVYKKEETTKRMGKIESKIETLYSIPMEIKEKGAEPVQVGKPVVDSRTTKTYYLNGFGDINSSKGIKETRLGYDHNNRKYGKIDFRSNNYSIKKSVEDGKWVLTEFKSKDIDYNKYSGKGKSLDIYLDSINEESLKNMPVKVKKQIQAVIKELISKLSKLR